MFKSKEIIQALEKKIIELETELKINKGVSFLLEEAIPVEENTRKRYMADVSLFYTMIFKDKLKHFIGLQMQELSMLGRSEKGNDIIRANINCFNLILEWMEEKTNEHLGNLENIRNSFSDNEEFINNIKKTYGDN